MPTAGSAAAVSDGGAVAAAAVLPATAWVPAGKRASKACWAINASCDSAAAAGEPATALGTTLAAARVEAGAALSWAVVAAPCAAARCGRAAGAAAAGNAPPTAAGSDWPCAPALAAELAAAGTAPRSSSAYWAALKARSDRVGAGYWVGAGPLPNGWL
ncbi:hypothetical protein FE772_24700 [Lysobacter enzymogenes]|nr:hypothetical protein [Lysobacter enzymogenes]QCW28372.1 hypothetical protein FE772_24700 [Lysobacter enzymogenes]